MLVHADGVEAVLLAQRHLIQMLGVDLAATDRIEERVRVRVVGRRVEVGPGQKIESVDLHGRNPTPDRGVDRLPSTTHICPRLTRMRERYGSLVSTAPPDTSRIDPDTHAASSEAKYTAAAATSAGWPTRRSG